MWWGLLQLHIESNDLDSSHVSDPTIGTGIASSLFQKQLQEPEPEPEQESEPEQGKSGCRGHCLCCTLTAELHIVREPPRSWLADSAEANLHKIEPKFSPK